jgi:hypothetical protein
MRVSTPCGVHTVAAKWLIPAGAAPAQVCAGVKLALRKTKPQIAHELKIRESSLADLTRKLYQILEVHNSAEFGARIWLSAMQERAPGLTPGRIKRPPSLRGDLAAGRP